MHRLAIVLARSLFVVAAAAALGEQPRSPIITVPNPPNTPAQQKKHYVVLVSLDGFRYDYPQKYGAPHLLALGRAGASAPDGMLPAYPSLTFPNHFTIVTGLYPEHHGIVANTFYDPARKQTFSYKNDATNSDGTWYSGTPLWSLAEAQGMRAASFFWPGSEAEIAGHRPTFYLHFQDKFPDTERIDQIITWLRLPPAQRPHFLTLYYSNVDHAGHTFGPDSDQTRDAVHHLDDKIGLLQKRLRQLRLPVDLVIVADHGMIAYRGEYIDLDHSADLFGVETDGDLLYPRTEQDAARVYAEFKQHPRSEYEVYRRVNVPADLEYNANPREGDPVIVPSGPFPIRVQPNAKSANERRPTAVGEHGFDPHTMPEMKAIFFAEGPDIRKGTRLPVFENVNVYDFIAELLGLTAAPNDGHPDVLAPALKRRP